MQRQHGVISRAQALACGLSKGQIERLLASGTWVRVLPRTFALGGAPDTWTRRMMAMCLWGGDNTFGSHRAAARLLDLDFPKSNFVEVTTEASLRAPVPDVIVHRSAPSLKRQTVFRNRIPVTDATRTLIDIASLMDEERLERGLDDALRKGLTGLDHLLLRLDLMGGPGKPGTALLRSLVVERIDDFGYAHSVLQGKLRRIFKTSKAVPMPELEYEIYENGVFLGRPDFAYPAATLAIEAESSKFHTGPYFQEHCARRGRFSEAGWEVLHATQADVNNRCAKLFPIIIKLLRERSPQGTFDV